MERKPIDELVEIYKKGTAPGATKEETQEAYDAWIALGRHFRTHLSTGEDISKADRPPSPGDSKMESTREQEKEDIEDDESAAPAKPHPFQLKNVLEVAIRFAFQNEVSTDRLQRVIDEVEEASGTHYSRSVAQLWAKYLEKEAPRLVTGILEGYLTAPDAFERNKEAIMATLGDFIDNYFESLEEKK